MFNTRKNNTLSKYLLLPVYSFYEAKLIKQVKKDPTPKHIAILCDGNRRWAKVSGQKNIIDGYRFGAKKVNEVIEWCSEIGIEHVTLYLLSAENLSRSETELKPLLNIISEVVSLACSSTEDYQVTVVGSLNILPTEFARNISNLVAGTKSNNGPHVNMAIGYAGRIEIVEAIQAYLADQYQRGLRGEELINSITEDAISGNLYTKGQPDPDLVVRTSGEQRLSGFLTWQSVYSEIWFTEVFWPEFRKLDFLRAIRDYGKRHRRFGK